MITSIAWRNVWRNPRRSLVIIISSIIGVAAGIFMLAFMNGWTKQRVHDTINTELSSIQVHDSMFMETEDLNLFMPNVGSLIPQIRKIEGVQAVSSHLVVNSMVKIAQESMGGRITGINPADKAAISDLPEKIIQGSWFQSDRPNPIILSQRTAKRLGVIVYQLDEQRLDSLRGLGVEESILEKLDTFTTSSYLMRLNEFQFDKNLGRILGQEVSTDVKKLIKEQAYYLRQRVKINVMMQDTSGNFHEESFSLCGIYKTSNSVFDEMNVFALRSDIERITALVPADAHQVSILLTDDADLEKVRTEIRNILPAYKVQTWKELDTVAKFYSEYNNSYTLIFMGIILLALFFGIVNTMLMAVLERRKEIGMLKAVGMNAFKVFRMILLESLFLTSVGSVIGIGVGALLNLIFSIHPINLGIFAQGLEGFGFATVVATNISSKDIILIAIMCFMTGILASIAPAWKAVKLQPVDAIRID